MVNYTLEAKEAIVKKALSRGGKTLLDIANESGIGHSTLDRWLKLKREGRPLGSVNDQARPNKDINAQLEHLFATSNLDEQAVGAYCREQGIYGFQLTRWKEELMTNYGHQNSKDDNSELKALRAENKELKKDINLKNKALAETSALLVLKKKAALIWGEVEDD